MKKLHLPKFGGVQSTALFAFWVALVIVLVLDALTVKRSYSLLGEAKTDNLGIPVSKSVRVNFDAYNQISDRMSKSTEYEPQEVTIENPFLSPPKKGQVP